MADRNFQAGFNNIYNWNLGFSLRRIYRKHHHLFVEAAQRGEKRECTLAAWIPDLALTSASMHAAGRADMCSTLPLRINKCSV